MDARNSLRSRGRTERRASRSLERQSPGLLTIAVVPRAGALSRPLSFLDQRLRNDPDRPDSRDVQIDECEGRYQADADRFPVSTGWLDVDGGPMLDELTRRGA